MILKLPELSLVVLIGPSGSGKSTFARRHFGPYEVVSSDFCRALISNDENNQAVSDSAFDLLHAILRHRLRLGLLTVVDATNVRPEDRRSLVALAREYHVLPVAIVFDIPERICQERNRGRTDRSFGAHVIRNQRDVMHRHLRHLGREGFRHVFTLKSAEEMDEAGIRRERLWNNRKDEPGPFDIIGDVHGCIDELVELLTLLGYAVRSGDEAGDAVEFVVTPPAGRRAIFLGDVVDRGPGIVAVLKLVMSMVEAGHALCVPGNHDIKLLRALQGRRISITHGLDRSLAELDQQPEAFRKRVADFLDGLVSHYVLDGGQLVVAHAGLKEEMQGRGSGRVRDFCLYGETTGETDEYGLPVRHNWAAAYQGKAAVVYGHTPVPEPEWLNGTLNIDTGCVYGGRLTALRYPERETVSVPARAVHAEPVRPLVAAPRDAEGLTAQQAVDDVLDLAGVAGKRVLDTRLMRNITIREAHGAAALEVMSRYAANPKWLIYLPPTLSPCETSRRPEFLEHPEDAFAYYRNQGVPRVVCERKHMGSRAVVALCRDETVARQRFGIAGDGRGVILTRTGRRFFDAAAMEHGLLQAVDDAARDSGFWDALDTRWVCLDCELMPWSAKAEPLLRDQYAAVGAAARRSVAATVSAVEKTQARIGDDGGLRANLDDRQRAVTAYVSAYRGYCWPVTSVSDLRLAPFHVLATEGHCHADRDHLWHLDWGRRLAEASAGIVQSTDSLVVEVTDEVSLRGGVEWWEALTDSGGEGMVVKPIDYVVSGRRGLIQPAIKCRGREYLRLIYGPEYTRPENLERPRSRALAGKRSLAVREFALGIEALERFVRGEPLRRVHECVFGVLALESEPVDPRL